MRELCIPVGMAERVFNQPAIRIDSGCRKKKWFGYLDRFQTARAREKPSSGEAESKLETLIKLFFLLQLSSAFFNYLLVLRVGSKCIEAL